MTGASPYSPLKVFYHQDKVADLRAGRQTVPLQVQLVISDLCNQGCSFCAYRTPGYTSSVHFPEGGHANPNRKIPYEKVLEILDDCVAMGVRAVQVTGGGEPTVHPQHTAIFEAVLSRGLELAVVTNGVRLSEADVRVLAEASWVRLSLDAGTDRTYAALRRVPPVQFWRVLRNLRALADHPGREDRVLGVGFVVTAENWWEVEEAARLARDAGAGNFRISAVFQPLGFRYFDTFHDEARTRCRAAEACATRTFTVSNLFGERLDDLGLGAPAQAFCGYQQLVTYIGGDQRLYRCCVYAYNDRGLIGSLEGRRFRDLWESEEKREAFASFDARGCEVCQFNVKNRMILSAMERPRHVNFL